MADNTTLNPGTGGDVIASDDLSTINGGGVSGVKVQRVKVGFGTDGDLKDVSTTVPLPVTSNTPLTPASPASASVGTSSGSIVSSNSSRKGLVLINLSAFNVSFGLGAAAVLNNGITLTPNGVWVMDQYTFTTDAIDAIAASAGCTVSIQEFS